MYIHVIKFTEILKNKNWMHYTTLKIIINHENIITVSIAISQIHSLRLRCEQKALAGSTVF